MSLIRRPLLPIALTQIGRMRDRSKKELALELYQRDSPKELTPEECQRQSEHYIRSKTKAEIIQDVQFFNTYGFRRTALTFDPVARHLQDFRDRESRRLGIYGYFFDSINLPAFREAEQDWKIWIRDTFSTGFIPVEELAKAEQWIVLRLKILSESVEPKHLVVRSFSAAYHEANEQKEDRCVYLLTLRETQDWERELREYYHLASLKWEDAR